MDSDYEKEIDLFFLRDRYNFHKCEALRLEDLKRQYTPAKIKEMARIICNIGKNKQKRPILLQMLLSNKLEQTYLKMIS